MNEVLGPKPRAYERNRRTAFSLVTLLVVAVLVIVGVWWQVRGKNDVRTSDRRPPPARSERLLGDYGSPLTKLGVDGLPHMDVPGTIARLKAANVTAYAYLVSPGPSQNPALSLSAWHDLPAFAESADHASIAVYVYLVPPSGARRTAYKPYGWDYASWAVAIAKVAVQHPSIRGIVLDDLGANINRRPNVDVVMTAAYLRDIMRRARQTAPWLSLSPVLYVDDVIGPKALLGAYRSVIDSVWFAYTAPIDSAAAQRQALEVSRRVASTIKCSDPLGCQSIRFPAASSDRGYQVFKRTTLVPSAIHRTLEFSVNLSSAVSGEGAIVVSLAGDGESLARRTVTEPAWTRVTMHLPDKQPRSGSLTLEIRRADATREPLDVVITTPRLDAEPMNASLPSEQHVLSPTSIVASRIGDLPVVAVTYATPFSTNRQLVPADEVGRSLDVVGQLMSERIVDGSMIYLLNLSAHSVGGSDPQSFAVVAKVYREWRRRPG